ncbi:hypothetical protein GCM10011390_29670 [Aureimonas endophytica]|uniref:Uncharacterized protein n=1 Tax=Aureimonas endophytica TaxID=2027858 RepID=A0A916ZQ18_9HYPH|nr:hypothetical protein GCM10011390_29670 [Aureimonas endophytica]
MLAAELVDLNRPRPAEASLQRMDEQAGAEAVGEKREDEAMRARQPGGAPPAGIGEKKAGGERQEKGGLQAVEIAQGGEQRLVGEAKALRSAAEERRQGDVEPWKGKGEKGIGDARREPETGQARQQGLRQDGAETGGTAKNEPPRRATGKRGGRPDERHCGGFLLAREAMPCPHDGHATVP